MRPNTAKETADSVNIIHHIDGSIRVIIPTRHATVSLSVQKDGTLDTMKFIEHTITEALADRECGKCGELYYGSYDSHICCDNCGDIGCERCNVTLAAEYINKLNA